MKFPCQVSFPAALLAGLSLFAAAGARAPIRDDRLLQVEAGAPGGPATGTPAPAEEGSAGRFEDLLSRAGAAEAAGRWSEAEALYREARQLRVADPRPPLGLARVALERGDVPAAQAALAPLWLDPAPGPEALRLLGEVRYRQERIAEAADLWERSLELRDDPELRALLERAQREAGVSGAYRLAARGHFRLSYSEADRSPHEREILRLLEEEYQRLSLELGKGPSEIGVILYTERDFRAATEAPDWIGGLFDGKVRVPVRGLDPEDARLRAVLAHELTHAFVDSLSRGNAPRWLHEGLAERFEGASAAAVEPDLAREFRESRNAYRWGFSYPRALSLVNYMVERKGTAGIARLLEGLAAGADLDTALRGVYHVDHARLVRDWGEALASRYP